MYTVRFIHYSIELRYLVALLACTIPFLNTKIVFSQGTEPTFPVFSVPEHQAEIQALNQFHLHHHQSAFSNCTLWDSWIPQSTIWASKQKREAYREVFLNRPIDAEGYVAVQQHRGLAHSDGWPFPAYQQSTGKGWHFSIEGDGWGVQQLGLKRERTFDGWALNGIEIVEINEKDGAILKIVDNSASITTPRVGCGTIVAPFLRLEWAGRDFSSAAKASIEWTIANQPGSSVEIPMPTTKIEYQNIPLYRQGNYAGIIDNYTIRFNEAKSGIIKLKSIITAIDTRHPITNSLFIRGCSDYFRWTGDISFLQENWDRISRSLLFALKEFHVIEAQHVIVNWVGHNGQSGLNFQSGIKQLRPGIGVGNNYWDLLPFGAHDAIATMYLVDAIDRYIQLSELVSSHSEWQIVSNTKTDEELLSVSNLKALVQSIREDFQVRFWNPATKRFGGWIDTEGKLYDYGFTFVNLEAIHYQMTTESQSRDIIEWLNGERIVEGDTSTGPDLYHWRFAPRATTKRNTETYVWVWSNPESIEWGDQVQDGGAVLGFSYFDLDARLKVLGPDDAWSRLKQILQWYKEVDKEGGYRAYYAKPGRGKLQGGGPPGGLGIDHEFMESVLIPQILLYGFLGFQPNGLEYEIHPKLPSSWSELKIEHVQFRDKRLTITGFQDGTWNVIEE